MDPDLGRPGHARRRRPADIAREVPEQTLAHRRLAALDRLDDFQRRMAIEHPVLPGDPDAVELIRQMRSKDDPDGYPEYEEDDPERAVRWPSIWGLFTLWFADYKIFRTTGPAVAIALSVALRSGSFAVALLAAAAGIALVNRDELSRLALQLEELVKAFDVELA